MTADRPGCIPVPAVFRVSSEPLRGSQEGTTHERIAITERVEELTEWSGRELFDAHSEMIGAIVGLGYPRPKFGTAWLAVDTAGGRRVIVPAAQISTGGDRLVLPYSRTYVEDGPALADDRPLSRAEERRLCLHYGLESVLPNSGCRQGCGLCMAERRAKRRR